LPKRGEKEDLCQRGGEKRQEYHLDYVEEPKLIMEFI